MAECKSHDYPDGARYCIQCGAPRTERRVLGFLMTAEPQPVFELTEEILQRADFVAIPLFVETYQKPRCVSPICIED